MPKEIKGSFLNVLKEQENSIKSGYDRTNNTWTPHVSPEGGNTTIGYGHKLTDAETSSGMITINGKKHSVRKGLTNTAVDDLFAQDFSKAEANAKKVIGAKAWDKLTERNKLLAAELEFNVRGGVKNFTQFLDKIQNQTLQDRAAEDIGRTFTNPKGEKVQLKQRVDALQNWYKDN